MKRKNQDTKLPLVSIHTISNIHIEQNKKDYANQQGDW